MLLALCACQSAPSEAPVASPFSRSDFSGHWEKDYQQSDDFNSRFNLYLFDLRRAVQRVSSDGGLAAGAGTSAYGSQEAVLGLARFAEEITRLPRLEILQDAEGILIEREGDYPLRCDWFEQGHAQRSNAFGSELCAWNGEQLVFQTQFDRELVLRHQLTLAPDGQALNLSTTLRSGAVTLPLTISNYYRRYAPPDDGFHCLLTLSRNKVCSPAAETP